MEQEHLKLILEALLFTSSKPLTAKDLAKASGEAETAITEALDAMVDERKNNGIVLLNSNGQYQMSTNSKASKYVKDFLNSELREKLTDATLEVLAIIAYRQPISKGEIEAIRGVNSQYSIRNLLMRGLAEKIPNPSDARGVLYQTTTEFLQNLGLTTVKDLPEFESLVGTIKLPETPQAHEATATQANNISQEAQTEESPKP